MLEVLAESFLLLVIGIYSLDEILGYKLVTTLHIVQLAHASVLWVSVQVLVRLDFSLHNLMKSYMYMGRGVCVLSLIHI